MKTVKNIISLLFVGLFLATFNQCTVKEDQIEPVIEEVVVVPQVEESLYDRLGGADGISSIVDDIVSTHLENPVVSPQFSYLTEDPEKMETVKRHLREFLGAGTGGAEQYTGVDVPTAHNGMNISNEEFIAAIDDIMFVLNNHEVSEQTKKDMLYILYSFKGQVVGL
jgi:hemoglobin